MGMVVRTNVMAMNANRQLGINNNQVGKSLEKLSSGFRINRAADDASGLAISEKMKAQIKGLETASANSQDGISLIQTAEGASTEIHDMLNRMTELATKSANGTIQDEVDREAIQQEVNDLNAEITRIAKSTNFNGINLLDGNLGGNTTKSAVTDFSASLGVALGAASTGIVGGTEATDSVVTDWKGITTNKVGTFTFEMGSYDDTGAWTAAATGDTVRVTLAESAATGGKTTTIEAKWSDIYSAKGTGAAGAVQAGDKISLNLGAFGLGKIDMVATGAQTEAGLKASLDGGVLTSTAGAGAAGTAGGLTLQVGDTADSFNKVTVSVDDLTASGIGTDGVDVSNQDAAASSVKTIKNAINKVSTNRANLGSLQNRLEHTINNLDTTAENMTAANSRIRDTDMAKEMMNYTKSNILTQAAQAMLAQANQQPQAILQLLQ